MANNSQEALAELQALQNSAQNPLDVYNQQQQAFGVGDVRNRVSSIRNTLLNTENALNQVDPSVTGRTSGSLVTEAQRQRLVNLERQPLAAQYGQQQGALSNEQATLSDLLGQAANQSNLIFQGQQQKISNAKDIYQALTAREAEQRRQAEADRAFALQQQQFEEQKRQALAAASRASYASAAAKPTRDDYNSLLAQTESKLRAFQGAGYRGELPDGNVLRNQLIGTFRGTVSPEEITSYLKQLYGRYYVNPGF